MPIVAGIILSAVADEIVLTHPSGHTELATALTAIGGPLVFMIGTILFKLDIRGFLQLSHGAGIVALLGLGWFATALSPLMLSVLATAVLVLVAIWESISLRIQAGGSGLRHQRVNREQLFRIGPGLEHLPARAARQRAEALDAVFVGALGVDALAGAEAEGGAQAAARSAISGSPDASRCGAARDCRSRGG